MCEYEQFIRIQMENLIVREHHIDDGFDFFTYNGLQRKNDKRRNNRHAQYG